jgi:hypothetical protein
MLFLINKKKDRIKKKKKNWALALICGWKKRKSAME